MTLKEYYQKLTKLIEDNSQALNFQVVYAEDDEGNGYSKVINEPIIAQIHDINSHYLEFIGFYDEEDKIVLEDCNAVIIN